MCDKSESCGVMLNTIVEGWEFNEDLQVTLQLLSGTLTEIKKT